MNTDGSVLVVGASAAGLATVETLRGKGHRGRVTVLDAATGPPYDRPPLSKQVLSGAWEPERAHLRTREALDALDAEFVLGEAAAGLDVADRTVRTASGRLLTAEAVVVATGLHPRRLPGQDALRGVHVLRTLDEARDLRRALGSARRVVVVGNGVLGSEIAATSATLGLHTTLVGVRAAPMEDRFGPCVASFLAAHHERGGVHLVNGTSVAAFSHRQGRVTGVQLSSGPTLPADVVVAAIGCVPATGWLAASGLSLDDGVVCDAACRAAPGVYAVGDVARFHHDGLGRHLRLENRTNATAQAAVVAANILGDSLTYAPVPYFWTDQFDAKIQLYGVPAAGADVTVVEGAPYRGADDRFVARYEQGGRTVAVLGWNMPKQARLHSGSLAAPASAATTGPARTLNAAPPPAP
ncbi:NAD(P)/FAD-dependent oxidoreductase [Streptomyces sp. NBC_01497]|uniref:NAD(P)/FAD-dependent oxidoreductase n=1 Tax=Streptomyces sp. NBC_01497 TaxID=2903885 RepID=UPI002E33A2F1|nr:FAD-dependent oxidoreductase [Streptomyces sp. NBC_01497]